MTNKKVCVYAICKNEMKFLDKWLTSMAEADYVVVLDTGSTDGSYEYLINDPRCYKVEQKEITPWRFDVARNESMKLIPEDAEIFVCTDPDEVFEEGWCTVLRENWNDDANRGFYKYVWSHTENGDPLEVFKYDKIHTREYHWIFPVHEVLWPVNTENFVETPVYFGDTITLHHWQDLTKDRKSYLDLLEISRQEWPESAHIQHLYAREFVLRGDYDTARDNFIQLLLMPDSENEGNKECLLDSYNTLAQIAIVNNKFSEGLYWAQQSVSKDDSFREPYLIAADIYNLFGDFEHAKSVIEEMYEKTYQHYSWVEKQANWLYTDKVILCIAEVNLGNYEKGLKYADEVLNYEPGHTLALQNKIVCLQNLQK